MMRTFWFQIRCSRLRFCFKIDAHTCALVSKSMFTPAFWFQSRCSRWRFGLKVDVCACVLVSKAKLTLALLLQNRCFRLRLGFNIDVTLAFVHGHGGGFSEIENLEFSKTQVAASVQAWIARVRWLFGLAISINDDGIRVLMERAHAGSL